MPTFKDNKGREWKLKVTFPVLRTMKEEGILDLFENPDPMQAMQVWLGADTVAQIDAIGLAVEQTANQAQKYEVYDFAEALDQESIWNGVMCFADALADFYPSQAKLMKQILSKARAKMESSQAKVTAAIDSGKFNGIIDDCMNSALPGSGVSSLPDSSESSESTITVSASEN